MYLLKLAQQKPAHAKYAEQSGKKDQHSTGNDKMLLQLGIIQCNKHRTDCFGKTIVRDSKPVLKLLLDALFLSEGSGETNIRACDQTRKPKTLHMQISM